MQEKFSGATEQFEQFPVRCSLITSIHYSVDDFCRIPAACTPEELKSLTHDYFPGHEFIQYMCADSRRDCALAVMKEEMCRSFGCRYFFWYTLIIIQVTV